MPFIVVNDVDIFCDVNHVPSIQWKIYYICIK